MRAREGQLCACPLDMPTRTFNSTYSNVVGFSAAMYVAVVVAIALFGSIAALAGVSEARAPLTWTIFFSTAASGMVAALTAEKSKQSDKQADELAEQHGMAAFVFSNSAATFVTLVANAVESAERRAPSVDNGVTYVINRWIAKDTAQNLFLYEAVLFLLAMLALGIIQQGADLLYKPVSIDEGKVRRVSRRSVWLLALGIGVGTTWQNIPYSAKEVASIWSLIIWGVGGLIAFTVFIHAVTRGLREFVSLIVNGVVHLGQQLAGAAASERWRKTAIDFAKGVSLGAVFLLALYATYLFSRQVVQSIASIPPEVASTTLDRVRDAIGRGVIWTAWTATGLGAIVAVRICFPYLKRVGIASSKAALRFIKVAAGSIRHLIVQIALMPYRIVKAIVRFARRLAVQQNPITASWPSSHPRYVGLFVELVARYANTVLPKRIQVRPMQWRRAQSVFAALSVVGVALLASSANRTVAPVVFVDLTPIELPEPELVIEPVEIAWPEVSSPSPLDTVTVRPVSLCEFPAAALNWVIGREDRLEVPLHRCSLPSNLQDSGRALIVVSLSSGEGNERRESQRATERGLALARSIYFSAPDSIDIYVLDLGVAKSPIPFRRLRGLFGSAAGQRPVPGLVVSPVPSDAILLSIEVGYRLEEYFRGSRLSDDFTHCSLSSFHPLAHESEQLRPVQFFHCGRTAEN